MKLMHHNLETGLLEGEIRIVFLNNLSLELNDLIIYSLIFNCIAYGPEGCCIYSNNDIAKLFKMHPNSVSRKISKQIKDRYFQAGYNEKTRERILILGSKSFKEFYSLELEDFINDTMKYNSTVKRSSLYPKKRIQILARDNYTCQYCGAKAPDVRLEVDHKVPVSKGGSSKEENLITSCWECNIGKGNMILHN